jgi:uncharacterized membrane protein
MLIGVSYLLLVIGYLLLVIGYWLLEKYLDYSNDCQESMKFFITHS